VNFKAVRTRLDTTPTTEPNQQRYDQDEVAFLIDNNTVDDSNNSKTEILNWLHSAPHQITLF